MSIERSKDFSGESIAELRKNLNKQSLGYAKKMVSTCDELWEIKLSMEIVQPAATCNIQLK